MKNSMILLFFLKIIVATGQINSESLTVINSTPKSTRVYQDENGVLKININQEHLEIIKRKGFISYGNMGALGNGTSDDLAFIVATHALANQYGLEVKADDGANYLIGGREMTAIIASNTDFGSATFIIDDTEVENRFASIFEVKSQLKPILIDTVKSLRKDQKKIDMTLKDDCLVTVTDTIVRRYIRYGLNQNKGRAQTDIFILNKNGNIDSSAPIIWNFDHVTNISALPIDKTPLVINGGRFVTIANKAPSKYTYYSRNISIERSNVVVTNLEHLIDGEGSQGAPYRGFISISDCTNILVKDCVLTGHKTYRTIGNAGKPVSMGSYDISVTRSIGVSFVNCSQTNDINDNRYWGIFASN